MIRAALAVLLLALAVAACGGGGGGGGDDGGGQKPDQPVLGASGDEEQPENAAPLGFPIFATKNTTRVAGADPVADAAAVARAVYPARTEESSPRAVVIVDQADWRSAISAAQLMARPLRAPILFSDSGELPAASAEALEELAPSGADEIDGAQVIRIGESAATPENRRSKDVAGESSASLAQGIDKLQAAAAGDPTQNVLIAPADSPEFAMPAAGWAARSGDPVLWTLKDTLPSETRAAIQAHPRARIYVLGPEDVISENVFRELRKLGRKTTRIAGPDPVANAIAFARFSDGRFGWNVVDPGHGLVFANTARTLDAAAAAPLSGSGQYGPLLLLTDAATLPETLQNYLLDIQPGYDQDPVRGVYNHGWLMGDETAISGDVQSRIDALLEIQPVDAGGD
ncbi:MAG TPA: cell wall-binding repeat-containing protein [Solirubrobacteraceae bacterium]|nr:cell wall-binding repeat-containing protein [Solirubrobacteraceae bacterium]